jgi:hypothetical protein
MAQHVAHPQQARVVDLRPGRERHDAGDPAHG